MQNKKTRAWKVYPSLAVSVKPNNAGINTFKHAVNCNFFVFRDNFFFKKKTKNTTTLSVLANIKCKYFIICTHTSLFCNKDNSLDYNNVLFSIVLFLKLFLFRAIVTPKKKKKEKHRKKRAKAEKGTKLSSLHFVYQRFFKTYTSIL